jgi:hypothetical protein
MWILVFYMKWARSETKKERQVLRASGASSHAREAVAKETGANCSILGPQKFRGGADSDEG